MDQDFTLLFDDETSSRLLQKWDVFFKPNVIKEAIRLTSTPELRRLVQSAESPPGSDLDEATCELYLFCLFKICYNCSYSFFLHYFHDYMYICTIKMYQCMYLWDSFLLDLICLFCVSLKVDFWDKYEQLMDDCLKLSHDASLFSFKLKVFNLKSFQLILVTLCPQPTTKKWPPCCCWYISFHHHQGHRSLQKLVHVMQLRDLWSFIR